MLKYCINIIVMILLFINYNYIVTKLMCVCVPCIVYTPTTLIIYARTPRSEYNYVLLFFLLQYVYIYIYLQMYLIYNIITHMYALIFSPFLFNQYNLILPYLKCIGAKSLNNFFLNKHEC